MHIYNFFLFSFINLIIIFIFVVIFYSIYDLPLKKIFKYCVKKDEIIEDEEDDKEEEIKDNKEYILGLDEEEDEDEEETELFKK